MDFVQTDTSSLNRKGTIISLQWFVVIGTSYLSLFSKAWGVEDVRVLVLVTVLFVSIFIVQRLPEAAFSYSYFSSALLIVDTILIVFGIGLSRNVPWDLFLLFFFCLFIAGIGETLLQVVSGCLLISIIFFMIRVSDGASPSVLDSDLLLRVPFIFGVSILYGYLAEQVKTERRRVEKLKETESLKRQLVSALAHDIMSPLGIITGYAKNVASHLSRGPGNEESLSALKQIQDNAARIFKLVMGFLDVSKTEAGKVDTARQPVQLNRLIREVGQQQMGDLRKKNLSLSVDLEDALPEVSGDEDQLERVLWNLLGNAIKFTPMGGRIAVSSQQQNDNVCVSVNDTGMGIPEPELPLLFSEFRRLNGAGAVEGTGLGLFIVKTVVEAHGGSVEAQSQGGHGTTFTIRFPVRT